MIEIVPAILPKNYFELEEKLALVRGLSRSVQIDVCDGKFTPQASWPYGRKYRAEAKTGEDKIHDSVYHGDPKFAAIMDESAGLPHWEDFDFEIDMMVSNPDLLSNDWVAAGASRLVIHLESISTDDLKKLSERLSGSVAIGAALNTDMPIEALEPIISSVSFVQCMGIARIGFQGEHFDEGTIGKVAALRKKYPELKISVDGGVNFLTAGRLAVAGANRLVVGSALFGSENVREAYKELSQIIFKSREK